MNKEVIIEKLVAIEEFAKDLREYLLSLDAEVTKAVAEKAEEPKAKTKKEAPAKTVEAPVVEETVEEVEEEEETEEDAIASIIEEYGLAELEVADLKDYLNSYEIEYNKRAKNKDYFVNLVAESIANGTIPTEEDESEEAEEAPEDVETEEEEEVSEDESEDAEEESDESEDVEEEEESGEPSEVSEDRLEAEAKIESDIKSQWEAKKLKETTIKNFLKAYYEGDPDCKDCRGECSKEEMLQCYIDIKKAFVDDDGDVASEGEAYMRDDEIFCCGKAVKELENGNVYCEICGSEFEV